MATLTTPPAPFGSITLYKAVMAIESLLGLNDVDAHTEKLTPRQRLDVGMREMGKPVLIDPLVQIMAAGRR
jgi:hypothetical protein